MICPRSYSKCGRAELQTEVPTVRPTALKSVQRTPPGWHPEVSFGSAIKVDGGAIDETMEKDNKLSLG